VPMGNRGGDDHDAGLPYRFVSQCLLPPSRTATPACGHNGGVLGKGRDFLGEAVGAHGSIQVLGLSLSTDLFCGFKTWLVWPTSGPLFCTFPALFGCPSLTIP